MPSNTTHLEGYTVFSSVSLAGSGATLLLQDITAYSNASIANVRAQSTLSVPGTARLSAVSSAASVLGQEVWTSVLSVGSAGFGGLGLVQMSATSFTVAGPITYTATKSVTTTQTINSLKSGGPVFVSLPSALSAGLVVQGQVSANSTLKLIYSNVSAANASMETHVVYAFWFNMV